MRKKFYECIIYTFIRGYINKNYNYYQPYILDCKRGFDEYNRCWLYKILKHFIQRQKMQDRFNNMINTKILVLVGIIIILSLVGFNMALIGVTFTVNSKYGEINNSINTKFNSINTEIKAINQKFNYKELLEVENAR